MDIIKYSIVNMCDKEHIYTLFDHFEIKYKKSDTYFVLGERYSLSGINIDLDFFKEFLVLRWNSAPIQNIINILQSGTLVNHNWHGAKPSILHLSLQNKVRDCIAGILPIEELIDIGADIMKHEFFMTAIHDLCESTIITRLDFVLPSIRSKSISDFIFKNIPFDLKITNYFEGHNIESVNLNKEDIARSLLLGADTSRIRKQAENTLNGWGSNRFYLLVYDQNRWLSEPQSVLEQFINEAKHLDEPFEINLKGNLILTHLIAI